MARCACPQCTADRWARRLAWLLVILGIAYVVFRVALAIAGLG